jgi:hypothetical protein
MIHVTKADGSKKIYLTLRSNETDMLCPWFSDLNPGVYYLVLALGDEIITREIIKK